jgi:monofunctional glycosyltransferase
VFILRRLALILWIRDRACKLRRVPHRERVRYGEGIPAAKTARKPRVSPKARSGKRTGLLRRVVLAALGLVVGFYLLWTLGLVYLRFLPPLTTGVQIQRRIEALFARKPYTKRAEWRTLRDISPNLQHAVIAAEDARFYQHHGIDFKELEVIVDDDLDDPKPVRGGSTLTQQLVKNVFFTTHRSFLRKGIEVTLAPLAELVLGKQRILELYLNVAEWGPGVYGAEAAAKYHYGGSASSLSRDQAARLAAILPSPLRRKPARMNSYSARIQTRMAQMGW